MKAYGVKRQDRGCCPGHDKFPSIGYNMRSRRSLKRWLKSAKARERRNNNANR
jgi:hypothetical protein